MTRAIRKAGGTAAEVAPMLEVPMLLR